MLTTATLPVPTVAPAAAPSLGNTASAATVDTATRNTTDVAGPGRGIRAATREVTLVNMSSHVLMLTAYEGVDPRHELPALGTVVSPHEQIQFQVAQHVLRHHELTAHFEVTDSHGNVLPHGYRLEIRTDRVGRSDRDAVQVGEISELHLTQDDIVLRNAIAPC